MTKKLTKMEKFEMVRAELTSPELVEFIEAEMALLAKRNGSRSESAKPTAKQIANAGVKETIVAFLKAHPDNAYTISMLQEEVDGLKGTSNQYVSSLMTQLVKAGTVVRETVKRKSVFSIA